MSDRYNACVPSNDTSGTEACEPVAADTRVRASLLDGTRFPLRGSAIHIVVVDDETSVPHPLGVCLRNAGFRVVLASTAAAALQTTTEIAPDLIIIKLEVAGATGLDLVRTIRESGSSVPIFALSIDSEEAKKVEAFERGADDYLIEPFAPAEVIARVRRTLRHRLQVEKKRSHFDRDELDVDLVQRTVHLRGEHVDLTPKEFQLLELMVLHAGTVLTRSFLLKRLWGPTTNAQHLRSYMKKLRQKIEPDPRCPRYIRTIAGVGYQLVAPE